MRIIVFFTFFSLLISACTKNTINSDTSGEVYQKYIGDYFATGSRIRFRTGIDTVTSVDSFRMEIVKYIIPPTDSIDSTLTESKLTINNFLGTGNIVNANASYSQIIPLTVLTNFRKILINSETKNILDYSYYKINGPADTSWYSGKATRL